jgi:signal transduction histidine kinase
VDHWLVDAQKVEQVLVNLLSNAIKYSPKADKVIVGIQKNKDNIQISVTDFGIGISVEHVTKIFDRFYRVENIEKSFSGLGIGLYISNEIVKRHGGVMWVESEEGKTSTFYFTVPLKQEADNG